MATAQEGHRFGLVTFYSAVARLEINIPGLIATDVVLGFEQVWRTNAQVK